MRSSIRKRIIAIILCMVLTLSGSMSSIASESMENTESTEQVLEVAEESAEEEVASEETEVVEETTEEEEEVTEEATEPEAPAEDTTVEENTETEETENAEEEVVETEETTETVENEVVTASSENEEDDKNETLTLTTELNGTTITMSGPKSSFPEGTEYSVSATELTEEAITDVEVALRKVELKNKTSVVSYKAYDIKLIVDGVEAQPTGDVNVTFQGEDVEEQIDGAENVEVYHVDENNQYAEKVDDKVKNNEVEMVTDHFSTYVITTTSPNGVDVTVQHYLTSGKKELYRESVEHLDVTERLEDISVAANYTVDKVVKINGNTETELSGEEVITQNTTYRVYYTPTTGETTGDVQMFDYQVRGENGASINAASNYPSSNKNQRFASGRLSHNANATRYEDVMVGGKEINEWENSQWYNDYSEPGIITGVNYQTGALEMGKGDSGQQLVEPGFFTVEGKDDPAKSGKQIYIKEYSLVFDRTGDTYVLDSVKNSNNTTVATAGGNFFPLDSMRNEYSDSSNDSGHNDFFGMRYDIEFSIGDYVGDLQYEFTGDDDLWVVLDAKNNGGKVVIDLGGIHGALTGTVDLWEALAEMYPEYADEFAERELSEAQRNATHTLTILYMERGANASNCNMKFTLPNSKVINSTQNPSNFSFKKVNSLDVAVAGAVFGLYDTSGTLLKTATSSSDGTVTFTNLYDGTYKIKETKAASGYVKSDVEWTLTVKNRVATMTVTGSDEEVTEVVNYTEKEEAVKNLSSGKTVSVVNEDDRTFKINLTAATKGETAGTAAKAASIILVLDASSSMSGDFDSLQDAVAGKEGFIDEIASVSPDSKIGIVFYNGSEDSSDKKAETKEFLTLNSTSNINQLKSFVNNKKTDGGTPMGDGLEAAYNMLKADTSGNEKYVIFFTDGMPGHWNTNDDNDSSTQKNCMVANNAVNYAKKIKDTNDGNAVLYTVGYNLGTDSFYWTEGHKATGSSCGNTSKHSSMTGTTFLSSKIATSSQHAFTAEKIDDLEAKFDDLAAELGSLFKVQAESIVDIIDARFELTDDSVNELKQQYGNDVSIVENADGTTTITWTGDAAMIQNEEEGGWATEFIVQAKPEFVGGNMIPTNGADSGINLEDNKKKPFPQPSVNVKLLEPSLEGKEITVYKGDVVDSTTFIKELADTLKVTKLYREAGEEISVIPVLTAEQLAALNAGTVDYVDVNYSYPNTSDVVGKFRFEYEPASTPETEHVESVSGEDVEVYTLKVTYIPDKIEERKDELTGITEPAANGGTVVASKETTADYIVNVISGEIQITKTLEKVATEDKTFTFVVTSDNSFNKEVTIVVPAGQTTASYIGEELKDLARGTYIVSEKDVAGYVVQNVEIGADTNCEYTKLIETATFVLGNSTLGIDVIDNNTYNTAAGGTLGIANFTNEEAIQDWAIVKRSSSSTVDHQIYLSGAEFELRLLDGDETATWYKGVSNADGTIIWYPNGGTEALTNEEYIARGEYILKEVKAPMGYAVSSATWNVTIGAKGALKDISVVEGTIVTETIDNVVRFYFDNEAIYELPSNGGFGIYWYMIAGIMLMMAATVILYKNRRKEVLERINRR